MSISGNETPFLPGLRASVRSARLRLLSVTLFLFLGVAMSAAQQQKLVSIAFSNEKATVVLRQVEKLSGTRIQYNYSDLNFKVTINVRNQPALSVVNTIIRGHGLTAQSKNSYIVIFRQKDTPRHEVDSKSVAGIVCDEKGEPLIGAVVRDREHKLSTLTNVDGWFSLSPDADNVVLEVSYLGMKPTTWKGHRGEYAMVFLTDAAETLQDVVVTGYQQLDRRNLTSSVVSKDMSELEIPGVSDLSKMLEGKIPDLVATTPSGEVNATSRLRIRGTSTIIGNREPLWVLDGIILTDPIDLSADVLNDPDYVNRIGNAIAGINPQDIQRVDVLKDAAATALYGTRAANGVIVVTTKSGREGKPIVSYSGQFTFRKRPYYTDSKINLMNSAERIAFSQYLAEQHYVYPTSMSQVGYEYALTQYYNGTITQQEFLQRVEQMENQNTDWFSILCHNSLSHDHNVNVSGGSDKIRYYTSIGYTDQDDVINDTKNRRYTAMAKVDVRLSRKFQMQFNVSGYLNNRDYAAPEVNYIDYAYNTSRAIPCYNADGSLYYYGRYANNGYRGDYYNYNIINEKQNSSTIQQTSNVMATVNLRYQPIENLFFNAVFSANASNGEVETWYGEKSFHSTNLRACNYGQTPSTDYSYMPYGGELSRSTSKNVGWTARFQGNYNKYLGANFRHNINLAIGLEASSSHYTGFSQTARGYYADRGKTFATNISSAYTRYWNWMKTNVPSVTDTKNNMVSAYATLSYSYRDLFTLNANGRYDGSNKFGSRSNEKLLPIWSVSGNANIMDIAGIKAPWINDLRLKSSYGEQGNMLDNQTSELIIRKGGMDTFYDEMVSDVAYFANPDLRWEKTHSFNVGAEASFLNNRLQIEVEYYYKRTTDAFMSKTISDINGYTSYVVNSGTITNSGFNTSLTATPVKLRNFYWIFSGNISKVYNKVKTAAGAETYTLSDFLSGTAVVRGQPVGTFYSYRFVGLSPSDGGPIIDDMEERQKEINEADEYTTYTTVLTPSGRREPNLTGSISNTLTYKQWRLSATFLYNFGAKTRLFRLFDGFSENGAFASDQNINRDFLDRWMKPGDELATNIPAIIGKGNDADQYYSYHWSSGSPYTGAVIGNNAWTMYDYSTARVVSADYVKLSTLSLTYELGRRSLDRLGLERLAITLSGYNLKTWCDKALKGQTPTQGGFSEVQLSDTPSWTLGVTLNF